MRRPPMPMDTHSADEKTRNVDGRGSRQMPPGHEATHDRFGIANVLSEASNYCPCPANIRL